MAKQLPIRRPSLESADLVRANIPPHLWTANLEGVTASVKPNIEGLLSRFHEMQRRNISLYVHGEEGTGKTGVGVVLLKEARHWGYSAYCASVADLREAVRRHEMFDTDSTVFDRARTVDFLLLDDVGISDNKEKMFSLHEVRNLVLGRWDHGLVTIVTSIEIPGGWRNKDAPEMTNAIHKSCVPLRVTGTNRHDATLKAKLDILKPADDLSPKIDILNPK